MLFWTTLFIAVPFWLPFGLVWLVRRWLAPGMPGWVAALAPGVAALVVVRASIPTYRKGTAREWNLFTELEAYFVAAALFWSVVAWACTRIGARVTATRTR